MDAIRRFIDLSREKRNKVIFGTRMELYTRVINRTPVDTGRARGSWNVSIETPNFQKKKRISSIQSLISNAETMAAENITRDFLIASGLEYMPALEAGSSQQNDRKGMIGITVAEFGSIVREQIDIYK